MIFHVDVHCKFLLRHIRRLSDIIRRGKRHFRRSLTRGRSEDDHTPVPVPLPHTPLSPPATSSPHPSKLPPLRSASFSSGVGPPTTAAPQVAVTPPGASRNIGEGARSGEGCQHYRYIDCQVSNSVQWNLSNPDTLGTEESVLISEVS